jgi:hypothetical protein
VRVVWSYGATTTVDARRLTKSSFKSSGYLEHHAVREAWSKDRDREWHSILSKPSRTGNAREIENIGKVCKLKFGNLKHQLSGLPNDRLYKTKAESRTLPNL